MIWVEGETVERFVFFKIVSCVFLGFLLCSSALAQGNRKVQLADDVFIEKIDDNVWRHVSSKTSRTLGCSLQWRHRAIWGRYSVGRLRME